MLAKKVFLSTLIISALFLNNCNNKREIINTKKNSKEIILKLDDPLEKRASLTSLEISLETKRNNEYLIKNIKNKSYLQDEKYLKEKIGKFVKYLKHTYVKEDTDNSIFYNLSELTLSQLQRVYLMCECLKDSSSLQEIGGIIEKDIADIYAEHGGIIIFNKEKIFLKTLESCGVKDTSNNNVYWPPDETYLIPNIGHFHLHATCYTEKKFAHPSPTDLITSYFATDVDNESNNFLITPIKRGTFNVDYYGGDKFSNPITRVLDLGNYGYDTTKIK